ncbi:MAG: PTS sugar transporter subunit IIA [Fibrobacteres bacterium]|nr:PTS sugar transporter subunit IIA [Fibrobacterota bacterium]
MHISDLLTNSSVVVPLISSNKEDIIKELIKAVPFDRSYAKEEAVIAAVLEREKVTSTGIGEGIAIPHAKCDIKEELAIAMGISIKPVDFTSIDGNPAQIFFMLLSRKDVSGLHIKTLARIAKLVRLDKFKENVLKCKNSHEVIELFRKEESQLP